MENRLVLLYLPMTKFHAKQIFVLSSSMKLGPGVCFPSIQTNYRLLILVLPIYRDVCTVSTVFMSILSTFSNTHWCIRVKPKLKEHVALDQTS